MTESPEQIQYNWSDAWLLLAIIYANKNGRASLDRIFAAGDFINHAIFKPEELESGLHRLTAGGFITRTDQGFDITMKVTEIARKLSRGAGYVREELEQIELVLSTSRRQRPLPNDLKYAGFSQRSYQAALKKYQAMFGNT